MTSSADEEALLVKRLKLEHIMGAPEAFRNRARSAASLLAAAAAALAAGLVFSDFVVNLSLLATLLALLTVALLIASVGAFMAAALYVDRTPTPVEPAAGSGEVQGAIHLQKASEGLADEIENRSRLGAKLGLVGGVSFVVTIILALIVPNEVGVEVQLLNNSTWSASTTCPSLPGEFHATARLSDLRSLDPLPVQIGSWVCSGVSHGPRVTIYLPRSDVLLAG